MDDYTVIFDVDGTLLTDGKSILEETREIVGRLGSELGVRFVLASARGASSLSKVSEALGVQCGLVCFNGALANLRSDAISISSQYIEFGALDKELAVSSLERLIDFDLTVSAFSSRKWIASRSDYWLDREVRGTWVTPDSIGHHDLLLIATEERIYKIQCRGESDQIEAAKLWLAENHRGRFKLYSDRPTVLEVVPRGCSKLVAVRGVLSAWQRSFDNALVFGDSDNDAELFAYSAHSVAMENGSEAIKAMAEFVIGDNNGPAIAKFLKGRFFQA